MTYTSPQKPRRGLGAIIDAIPTQRDYVPDSCSEGSDSEEEREPIPTPKPIPLTPLAMRPNMGAGSVSRLRQGAAVAGSAKGKGREEPRVEVTVNSRGQTVYQTERPSGDVALFFAVQWRRPQQKKVQIYSVTKTWDGDATIKVENNRIVMLDEDGNNMAIGALGDKVIKSEAEFRIGQFEVQVDHPLQSEQFKASTSILNRPKAPSIATPGSAYRPAPFAKPFRPPAQVNSPRPGITPARPQTTSLIDSPTAGPSRTTPTAAAAQRAVAASSFYGKPSPKPKGERIVLGEKSNKDRLEWGGALFNPHAPGAVVMPRPPEKIAKMKGTEIVDVVIDPVLASLMRDHQKEGVKFMYSCVMGLTQAEGEGCILADEMGLGKTLQTIALVHTLLKQSPFANQSSVIGKAIIVCPVTLVENWRKEFKKWVDRRINVLIADGTDYRVSSFINNKHQHVLVIGYERLRKEIKELASCQPPIDLIVCDEGHRLKSKDNKTTKMFDLLKTQRRIILSGTPVQNDLGEYWAMVNFACPGMLGKYAAFAKHYEKPILKSRAINCPAKDVELGRERADDLAKLSKEFVLRRTSAVLENYLPPKYEYVVFIAPSALQLSVLSRLLNPSVIGNFIRGYGAQSLALIDTMRKVSNSPMLLRKKDDEGTKADEIKSATNSALAAIPSSININDVTTSGKMLMLDKMLHAMYTTTEEKVVVVSNWTATLDLIQGLLKNKKYAYLRLDGSTPQKQRQELVDRFNRDKKREGSFVFLLSAKAGGVGLNLIGGSRLILFDSDWNPSTDLQAMARIHRDGQKRPVYIYRFLTTNAIDEKIYQRQITKTGLSDQMMDQAQTANESKDSFSAAELKDIFTLNVKTDGCQTHDLLGCDCTHPALLEKDGNIPEVPDDDSEEDDQPKFVSAGKYDPTPTPRMRRKAVEDQRDKLAALKRWTHFDPYQSKSFRGVQDSLLYNILFDSWDKDKLPNTAGEDSEDEQDVDDAESEAEEDELESDGDGGAVPRKRKAGTASKGLKKKAKGREFKDPALAKKRHNLRTISEKGETGRVTFVFEKVSKSKL
ncbi:hypothetical protein IAT38_007471 [Cryptococcus sp. DSM 104549]